MLAFRLFLLLIAALLQACGSAPTSTPETPGQADLNPPILVSDKGDRFDLSVSLSDITMSLPKGALRRENNNLGGATASRRYFYFTDSSAVVSGWFEGRPRYTDLRGRWRSEMEGLRRQGLPGPTDVEDVQVGPMKGILYTFLTPQGSSSHLRSTYLSPGTWVDLHLSFTSSATPSETRARVLALAGSITFSPKRAR